MRECVRLFGLLLLQLLPAVHAVEVSIDQTAKNDRQCAGMYSKKAWGGPTNPYISVMIPDSENNFPADSDPTISLLIFEWKDKNLLGRPLSGADSDDQTLKLICDQSDVDSGLCNSTQIGSYLLAENALENSKAAIVATAYKPKTDKPITYEVKKTGYYCVFTYPFSENDYKGVVIFRNAFGELPAAQIAKLPFYAAITIVYAFLAMGWGALYWLNRRDILPVQNYITAILMFLVVEMFITWLFYDYQNRHGLNGGAKALLVVVSILSAARNSFSFFLLLIVCMGYGVVKETLGKTMTWVRYLAVTHFVFGVIYAMASLSVTPENAGPIVLLVVLPLAGTLTAFYVWTLNSLNYTMKDLMERKQTVKAAMYRRLWWCILLSIIVIFAFFFINSWTFAGSSSEDFVPTHWPSRWFILDGWLNLVYFFDVAFIAYVWRPTANNRRFAMSDEIAQDDDGFEIASIRDSFEIDDDLEAINTAQGKPPAYDAPSGGGSNMNRDASPLPAPRPTKPAPIPRESLDGETIFAVGEDGDKFSDDEDEDERKGLTHGKD